MKCTCFRDCLSLQKSRQNHLYTQRFDCLGFQKLQAVKLVHTAILSLCSTQLSPQCPVLSKRTLCLNKHVTETSNKKASIRLTILEAAQCQVTAITASIEHAANMRMTNTRLKLAFSPLGPTRTCSSVQGRCCAGYLDCSRPSGHLHGMRRMAQAGFLKM